MQTDHLRKFDPIQIWVFSIGIHLVLKQQGHLLFQVALFCNFFVALALKIRESGCLLSQETQKTSFHRHYAVFVHHRKAEVLKKQRWRRRGELNLAKVAIHVSTAVFKIFNFCEVCRQAVKARLVRGKNKNNLSSLTTCRSDRYRRGVPSS